MQYKKIFSLLFILPILTSCTQVPFIFERYSTEGSSILSTHEEVSENNYYRTLKPYTYELPCEVNKGSENTLKIIDNLYAFKKTSEDKRLFNSYHFGEDLQQYSTLNLNILVVPIAYSDSPTFDHKVLQEEYIIKLQNAFFGTKRHNKYYSVSEYYYRSSYGHISLSGEVLPFYQLNKASTSFSQTMQEAQKIAATISGWLKGENSPISSENLKNYDQNLDSYIDGIYLLYDHPSKDSKNPFYWHVSDQITDYELGYDNFDNKGIPHIRDYSWSSLDCLGPDKIVDSKYFIHEIGHLFGLEDYYNTEGGNYQPTGFLDMMDYNIGDHSAFSKFLLNWTSPYVLTNEGSISIKTFQNSGDFILIPANLENYSKHNSPFDEYLLIEYFSPREMNDSIYCPAYVYTDAFGNQHMFKTPENYGLKIYHVDARLAYYSMNNNSPFARIGLVTDPVFDSDSDKYDANKAKNIRSISYALDNSTRLVEENSATLPDGPEVLYHLLEATGENTFLNAVGAKEDTLLKIGQIFGETHYPNFKFHDGSELAYTFEMTRFSRDEVTIKFVRK